MHRKDNDEINDIIDGVVINGEVNGIPVIELTKDEMIEHVTEEYFIGFDPTLVYDKIQIKTELLHITHMHIQLHNECYKKWKPLHWRGSENLFPQQIAIIIMHIYNVKMINMGGKENSIESDYMMLGVYQDEGENEGIYLSTQRAIEQIIQKYNRSIKPEEIKQVIKYLETRCEVVMRCDDRDLIPVQNGIFNFKTKELQPFDPELVFTSKCRVDYVPWAVNPIIPNPDGTNWDVQSWLEEMFDYDPDMVDVIWQILSAVVRPNVNWGKCIWFLSTRGNNGKGTLCQLMRNILGHDSYAALKIADFDKEFLLEPLIHASAVITDENDVGNFIRGAANFKSVITGDTININRKNRIPVVFQPRMLMVQCVNEMPQFKDKSESLYRRQIIIEFKKSYTGREKKYIKDDYLGRKPVLQYVLWRVLNMSHYSITETPSIKAMLEKYKQYNEPVRDFLDEILIEVCLYFLPQSLLWDMYRQWSVRNNPHGSLPKRNKFLEEMKDIMDNNTDWEYTPYPVDASKLMNIYEPLLEKYNLREWYQEYPYNPQQMRSEKLYTKHRGYKRVAPKHTVTSTANTAGKTDTDTDTEDQDN